MTGVTNTTRRELLVVLVRNVPFFSLYSKRRKAFLLALLDRC
nr:MAG TPA: hypothetical protein [Caudoviricetes sp.]